MKTRAPIWLAFLLFLSLASKSVAEDPLVVPVAGEPFHGRLAAGDSNDSLAFKVEQQTRTLPADELVHWGACVEPDRAPVFVLRDGTLLVAGILEATEKDLALDSDTLGLVRLPQTQIAGVVLRLPASRLDRDRLLDEAGRNDGDAARVVLLNGDRMQGELVGLDDRKATLRTPVGTIDLELERLSSITFPAETADQPTGRTIVGLADGCRLQTDGFKIKDQVAALTVGDGISCRTDVAEIVYVQPSPPRIVYLSDMTPAGYRHVPYLDRTWQYQPDRNVLGGHLRCAGQLHLKGMGMHTAARISYVPPEGAVSFQSSLGIDDATEGLGSVRFRVFVDGSQKFVSPTVRGLDPPVPVTVDVRGAERIDLVVDFADRADVQDHANWLDARFVLGD